MIRVSGLAALDAWLAQRYDFADGHLARVGQSPHGRVTLRLEQYVELGLRPGDVSVVDWRMLGARTPRASGEDHDGCFLQVASRLADTDHGVFCLRGHAGHDTFRTYGRDTGADLWQAARTAAAHFEQVRSGNCVFDRADWAIHVSTGGFPPVDRLRRDLAGRR